MSISRQELKETTLCYGASCKVFYGLTKKKKKKKKALLKLCGFRVVILTASHGPPKWMEFAQLSSHIFTKFHTAVGL